MTDDQREIVDSDFAAATEADVVEADVEEIKKSAREARVRYEGVRGLFADFAKSIESILQLCINAEKLPVHSITSRAKDANSFERKAARVSADDPRSPRYSDPLEQITDKAGVRIISYFLSTLQRITDIIYEQFEVLEAAERAPAQPDRLGYQSLHYLVSYKTDRTSLPEYSQFTGLVAELQVRTILQHAWAEIEHDIQYKATDVLPTPIRRRFASLAGLIEIADREFQAIQDTDRELREEAKRRVDLGQLDRVEITADSLHTYLDNAYGPDRRMSDWSYGWTARLLVRLGFANLAEVDECIKGYDDDRISRILFNSRMGQLTRFENVLLASMGEYFILPHPWVLDGRNRNYIGSLLSIIKKLQTNGIEVGSYRPPNYPATKLSVGDLQRIADEAEQARQEWRARLVEEADDE